MFLESFEENRLQCLFDSFKIFMFSFKPSTSLIKFILLIISKNLQFILKL